MRKIVYVDMDNVLVDFGAAVLDLSGALRREYEGWLDEVPGIFSAMPPMPGALVAFELLAAAYDVYVLSTAPWENPSAWSDKHLWVRRHLGAAAHKRLILTHHKHLNRGHYLIDDREKNGAERFEGELILFGSTRFPDWAAVTSYLLD